MVEFELFATTHIIARIICLNQINIYLSVQKEEFGIQKTNWYCCTMITRDMNYGIGLHDELVKQKGEFYELKVLEKKNNYA